MKKRFIDTEAWKWIKLLIELLLIAAIVWGAIELYTSLGLGEARADEYHETMFVLCDDYVNVRSSPSKRQEPIGRLEVGDSVTIDGRKKNGYVHCVDLTFESEEGWVFAGYLTEYKPEKIGRQATIVSKGRLAARKYVNGRRTRWLKSGAKLKVRYWTEEWALTDCGYVQSKYLELDGE